MYKNYTKRTNIHEYSKNMKLNSKNNDNQFPIITISGDNTPRDEAKHGTNGEETSVEAQPVEIHCDFLPKIIFNSRDILLPWTFTYPHPLFF